MKKIPIGVSDYKNLVDGDYYYVDKTLLIGDILNSGAVVLMTRPRRFGKTLNLSMVRYFLEKSENSTEYLFNTTKIWDHKEYHELQGSSPVIFVCFKDVKEPSWEAAYDSFALVLSNEFDRHDYLLEGDTLKPHERELYQRILERRASSIELKASLNFLAKVLHRHHKKKPFLLIDEYDTPIQKAFLEGYYEPAISFLQGLLATVLKDGNEIEKGVVTGILTLTKAGIFSGLNNLDVFDLTSVNISDKFGFTEDEVTQLLEYYGYSERSKDIKQWYDGYTLGKTSAMYNPWSVLSCLRNEGMLQNYWVSTSSNDLVKRLIGRASIDVKANLEKLLTGKTATETIYSSITFPEVETRSDILWSLLLFTGYVTYSEYTIKDGRVHASLKIPNEELQHLYAELISSIFKESILGGQVAHLLEALTIGDTEIFSKLLQSFVYTSMSSFDLSSSEPEKSYHLFVLGLLVALSDTYEVKSNKESGLGRYDITLIPRVNNKPGIVMEFKVVRKGEDIEDVSTKALDQITQKKYTQELFDRSVSKVLAYGIAFEGKTIHVSSSEVDS